MSLLRFNYHRFWGMSQLPSASVAVPCPSGEDNVAAVTGIMCESPQEATVIVARAPARDEPRAVLHWPLLALMSPMQAQEQPWGWDGTEQATSG